MKCYLALGLGIILFTLSACDNSATKILSGNQYSKPKASRLNASDLQPMSFPEARQIECVPNLRNTGVTSTITTIIAATLADEVLKYVSRQLKEKLKEYVKSTSLFSESELPINDTKCVEIQYNNAQVLLLKVRAFPRSGVKFQPVWFDPKPFRPKITTDLDNFDPSSEMAFVVAMQPTYFVRSTRRSEISVQLVSTKMSLSLANQGGLLISSKSRPSFSDLPMLAAPPPGQLATLKTDIATAIEPPVLLRSLESILSKNQDDLSESLTEALLQLVGVEEED